VTECLERISIIGSQVERLRLALATPWIRTIAVLWIAQVISEIGFGFALPFTPLFVRDELGVPDMKEAAIWAGVAAASFAVAMGVMAPIWGTLADRFGHRLMIQRAFIGAGLALGAISLVHTPEQMIALRILHGALTGVFTGIATFVSLTTPSHHLGTVLGLMQSALFLGIGLGPVLGGMVSDQFGYRAAFGVTGVVLSLSGVLIAFVVHEPPKATDQKFDPDTEAEAAGRRDPRRLRRQMLLVVGLMAIVRIANVAPNPILPFFLESLVESTDHIASTVGLMLGVTAVASTFSALIVGRLADRFGRRTALFGCCVLTALLCPLHVLVGSAWQLIVLRTVVGLTEGGMATALQALLVDITPPSRRGVAFGWITTASSIGNGAGPVSGSTTAATYGVHAVFLVITPLYLVAASVLALLCQRGSRLRMPIAGQVS
jgi:DHA1 family multidrug resistance protein-like MFS transporter